MKNTVIQILCCILWINYCAHAQRFDNVEIIPEEIGEQTYMLTGAGGNILLIAGPEGNLMIDSQFGDLSEKIETTIKEINNEDIVYLINTHWHGDHVGGNPNFGKNGATILAHENVRKRVTTEQIRPFRPATPPLDSTGWPVITFNDKMSVHFNGKEIQMIHVDNAHTDTDAFAYLPGENIIHLGDCFFKDRFPFIDLDAGGSVDGYISALQAALLIVDEETIIVPGHGTLSKKEDLTRFHTMLTTMKGRVEEAMNNTAQGDTLQYQTLTEGYESWGEGFINSQKLVQTIENDISRRKEKE